MGYKSNCDWMLFLASPKPFVGVQTHNFVFTKPTLERLHTPTIDGTKYRPQIPKTIQCTAYRCMSYTHLNNVSSKRLNLLEETFIFIDNHHFLQWILDRKCPSVPTNSPQLYNRLHPADCCLYVGVYKLLPRFWHHQKVNTLLLHFSHNDISQISVERFCQKRGERCLQMISTKIKQPATYLMD